jgi:shikimate kinase
MLPEKIILIGFMGSGKSSVAALLAQTIGYEFIEADNLVISLSGCSNIREIFNNFGEPRFRELETQVTESLRNSSQVVISTGGGVIGNHENMKNLSENGGYTIFLDTSLNEVFSRVTDMSNRPLLRDRQKAAAIFSARLPVYRSYADLIVSTNSKSTSEVANEIITKIGERS